MPPIALVLAASGCAVDNHGVVLGRITHADGAVVADLYAIGLHLKTRSGDAGLVLGYSRASYVFAMETGQSFLEEGWHTLSVPMPATPPKALHLESAGVSGHANHSTLGMTLGCRVFTLIAWARTDASEISRLHYRPDLPSATRLRECREEAQCKDLLWQ